jgi:hypothetical protein
MIAKLAQPALHMLGYAIVRHNVAGDDPSEDPHRAVLDAASRIVAELAQDPVTKALTSSMFMQHRQNFARPAQEGECTQLYVNILEAVIRAGM